MTANKFPSGSREDRSCPTAGDGSAKVWSCLPPVEDAKASHITQEDDWFPPSQWPSSGSASNNSTDRLSSHGCSGPHGSPLNSEPPAIFSHELLREADSWNTKNQALCETLDSAQGVRQDACRPEHLTRGTGSPRASTSVSSLGADGVTVGVLQLPQQCAGSWTNRTGCKKALVCGPLSVQQTLTERQLDIEKRMVEVRQQNRRRLHRRQQEAKEQQLQRMREHRAALLARRERIKLASVWKERGMAAAAKPSTIFKGRGKMERIPSDASQATENDTRSTDELLAALVISESISLNTEIGTSEDGINTDLAKRATYPPSSYRCPGRLPEDKNVSARLATLQHTVSASPNCDQHKDSRFNRYLRTVRQPTDEPRRANIRSSLPGASNKPREQATCTLPGSLIRCQRGNRLASSQKMGSLLPQFQGMPYVPNSPSQAQSLRKGAVPLALRRPAKPGVKQAAAEEASNSSSQRGEGRSSSSSKEQEGEHKRQVSRKIMPAVVVVDQLLKKQLDVQLQQHKQHGLTSQKGRHCVTDTPLDHLSPSVSSVRNSTSVCRPPTTRSKATQEIGAPEIAKSAYLPVHEVADIANTCQQKECMLPSIPCKESASMQPRSRCAPEETDVPWVAHTERLICRLDNFMATEPENASSAAPNMWAGSAEAQPKGVQLVRICAKGLSKRELEDVGPPDPRKAPRETSYMDESASNRAASQQMPLGEKDRCIMRLPSSHGEPDGSSGATKPQGEIDKNIGHAETKGVEQKLQASTQNVNVQLIGDECPTLSAVWALQQAEVEEEKRLLLLEMSHHAIAKHAEKRRKEQNLQSQLLAQHFQMKHPNNPGTFATSSQPLPKGQPCADSCSLVVHPVKDSLRTKTERCTPQKPSEECACREIPARSYAPFFVPKEEKMQTVGDPTQRAQSGKHWRLGPAFRALKASTRTTPRPKLRSLSPSKNPREICRPAGMTICGDDKLQDDGREHQLQSGFLLKQHQTLISQLLQQGLLAGHNRGRTEVTGTAVFSSDSCLPLCGHREMQDTCLQVRAIQRRTVLQALQHLLLFPPKTYHRNTLKKESNLGKGWKAFPRMDQKREINQRNYQTQVSLGQSRNPAPCAIKSIIPEGTEAESRLFGSASLIKSGASGLPSLRFISWERGAH